MPRSHDCNSVARGVNCCLIIADQQHRETEFIASELNGLKDPVLNSHINSRGRLICNDQIWDSDQSHGHENTLVFPHTELRRFHLLSQNGISELHEVQGLHYTHKHTLLRDLARFIVHKERFCSLFNDLGVWIQRLRSSLRNVGNPVSPYSSILVFNELD